MTTLCQLVSVSLLPVLFVGCFRNHATVPSGEHDAGSVDMAHSPVDIVDMGTPTIDSDAGVPPIDCGAGERTVAARIETACASDSFSSWRGSTLAVQLEGCFCSSMPPRCAVSIDSEYHVVNATVTACSGPCDECEHPTTSCELPLLDEGEWDVRVNGDYAFRTQVSHEEGGLEPPAPFCARAADAPPSDISTNRCNFPGWPANGEWEFMTPIACVGERADDGTTRTVLRFELNNVLTDVLPCREISGGCIVRRVADDTLEVVGYDVGCSRDPATADATCDGDVTAHVDCDVPVGLEEGTYFVRDASGSMAEWLHIGDGPSSISCTPAGAR